MARLFPACTQPAGSSAARGPNPAPPSLTHSETVPTCSRIARTSTPRPEPDAETFSAYLDSKGIKYTTWEGWHRLDDHEKALGARHPRTAPVSLALA